MNRDTKNKLGCIAVVVIFIAALVLSFMFGSYVGSEVTTAIGWNVTSSVVNFIIGMVSIGLILSVCTIVLAFIIIFVGFIAAALIK